MTVTPSFTKRILLPTVFMPINRIKVFWSSACPPPIPDCPIWHMNTSWSLDVSLKEAHSMISITMWPQFTSHDPPPCPPPLTGPMGLKVRVCLKKRKSVSLKKHGVPRLPERPYYYLLFQGTSKQWPGANWCIPPCWQRQGLTQKVLLWSREL